MNIIQALKKGNEVSNSEAVKKWQNRINALSIVAIAVIQASAQVGFNIPLSQDTINNVTASIVSVLPLLNIVFTTISSKKVGVS